MNNISEEQHMNNSPTNGLAFIKEVVKYFMDFLETDFHKRRDPKRTVKNRNDNNLLIGIDLSKYPKFKKIVFETFHQGFKKNTTSSIRRGAYQANIPGDLLQLTKLQCQRLTEDQIGNLLNIVADGLIKAVSDTKEYDRALFTALEFSQTKIKSELTHPFIMFLDQPLRNMSLGDENTVYLMEDELASIFCKRLEDKIAEIVRLLIMGEKPDAKKELALAFNLEEMKNDIIEFFENYQVKDLYAELYQIYRNKDILDKQDTYLYFYDISFGNKKYPIFYIPFNIEKEAEVLTLDFDAQVYINKKALEYIVQKHNEISNNKGSLKTIGERIIYLSQHKDTFSTVVSGIINEITDFFELDSTIRISDPVTQTAKSGSVKVSNTCYINLSEKSDEALINDYEEILQLLSQEDSILGEAFNGLIDDFIRKEPISFDSEIADEWDDKEIGDKLVFETPVPLNAEQRQILEAIQKEGCKYITVEGPPGTGKSHTITAIVCDAILNDRSVLVLSDKKEALDVVEDKITQTMDQVRFDKNFQNPILRLGKTGNTYSKILSTSSIDNIKVHHRVLKNDHETLMENIAKSTNTLKEYIEAEVLAYEGINNEEIRELAELELYYAENFCPIELTETSGIPNSAILIEDSKELMRNLSIFFADRRSKVQSDKLFELFRTSVSDFKDIDVCCDFLDILGKTVNYSRQLTTLHQHGAELLAYFQEFSDAHLEQLNLLVTQYEKCKNWLFGYFLKSARVEQLNQEFREAFPECKFEEPHKYLKQLRIVLNFLKLVVSQKDQFFEAPNIDCLTILHGFCKDNSLYDVAEELSSFSEDIRFFGQNLSRYPKTLKTLRINLSELSSLWDNVLLDLTDDEFNKIIRYISLDEKITQSFNATEPFDYGTNKKTIEELVTFQMTYLLDGSVVDFYEHNKATTVALRTIINNKSKFPRDEFAKLKNAFPCILAGIRDYAEYIPLAPEIFDLVIIDEASQVSVAQAFPALLRAKKVVVFGDKKQFSNIKAAQARSDTNIEYLNNLERSFRENVSQDPIKLVKLQKFNIKTSILEFFEFITNFNIRLLKHFRGYKELISYSDKYFYQGDLQVMKIRGKPIDDVLKFTFIEHDGKKELFHNTNKPEIEFIISELQQLKESKIDASVGLITPHTNQQKLAMEMISKLPDRDYYFDTNKLKIMTFDTCQGEERDIIFYSMVANEESDRLWGVFIKDLASVDLEEESKIKAQRLNVGFSRAKECIHLVLSKPLDGYSGAIGDALDHYQKTLTDARSERTAIDVDSRSPMEAELLNWFYQTGFWEENRDNAELIPGFEIGKYLRQLDRTYKHPNYVVDFLLIYRNGNKEHKIIIEYDGFKEHFHDTDARDEFRHDYYYSEADVYREKVLESYGYKFLRVNKFNIGTNPISTLDTRIKSLIKGESANTSFLSSVHAIVGAYQNGEIRQCPKCEEIKNNDDFRDIALLSGYGRICNHCKEKKRTESRPATRVAVRRTPARSTYATGRTCPSCGSRMVPRNGRHGRFWGCSRYPYCRGTRNN
ncbi:AAA domain-containing protein [Chloroflexota bacterium]